MPTIIDPKKIPQEITDKYSIVSNAFRLVNVKNAELDKKGTPKDLIVTEVGDVKQQEFYPQLKLGRWGNTENDNEVNFSVRLIENEIGTAKISFDKEKIIWDKGNFKVEYFDYEEGEGGYKMIPYLKAKPATNQVRFSVKRKGLSFYRQPPLTEEYQNGWSDEFQTEIVVTETDVKDLEGNVLVHRPPEVVNSFAIYHNTKGGMNDINGKDYKTGQFGFDYRPKLIDANGLEVWADLDYVWFDEENGERILTFPQEFLDRAVCPIKSNDTIGYTTGGGSSSSFAWNNDPTFWSNRRGEANTATGSGTVSDLNFYALTNEASAVNILTGLYINQKDSGGANIHGLIGGGEIIISYPTSADWRQISGLSFNISNGVTYILNGVANSKNLAVTKSVYVRYNTATSEQYYTETFSGADPDTVYASSKEDPWTRNGGGTTYRYSIYATYTPAGGQQYTANLLDTITATDTTQKLFKTSKKVSDRFVLTDAIIKRQGISKSFIDSFSLTDVFNKVSGSIRILSEPLLISDVLTRKQTFFKNLSDEISLNEVFSKVYSAFKNLSDVVGLSDVISKAVSFGKLLQEQITLEDLISAGKRFYVVLSDKIILTKVAIGEYAAILSETLKLTDTIETINSFAKELSDAIKLEDTLQKTSSFFKKLVDVVSITDIAAQVRKTFQKILSDTISLADTISRIQEFKKALVEIVSLSDIVSKTAQFKKSITDAISLIDTLAISTVQEFIVKLTETITLSETWTKLTAFKKALTDDVALSDISSSIIGFFLNLSDAVKLTDVVSAVRKAFLVLIETLSLTDILSKLSRWAERLNETIKLRDVISIPRTWWRGLTKHLATWTEAAKNTATWTELSKHTASWTELNKNTASWSEATKHTSSWTHLNKH